MQRSDVTPELLKQLVRYDAQRGLLFWRERTPAFFRDDRMADAQSRCQRWNKRYANKQGFRSRTGNGYLFGSIFNMPFMAHRVAIAITCGFWPENVDHINGLRTDNRIENLRAASVLENRRNCCARNNPYPTGIYKRRDSGKFVAQIGVDYGTKYLGSYDDIADALAARKRAEVKYGFHENHGRLRP